LKHKYTVQITRAICTKESYEVYQKYQAKIHNEVDKSKSGYSRFLCETPLFDPADKKEAERNPTEDSNRDDSREAKDEGVWPEYLGSYHMIHRIDGEIMALGVLDNTPNVLSSVYLYYNPKFEFLQPGTFSAVREIEYCLRI
jgi:arginine-tRNA-protein transferase